MLTYDQVQQVKHSFKHGDDFVFQIEGRVFVAETVLKHKKEATVEFQECYEIDETCFEGEDYYGETLSEEKLIIIEDTFADYENIVSSFYYQDEVKEERSIN